MSFKPLGPGEAGEGPATPPQRENGEGRGAAADPAPPLCACKLWMARRAASPARRGRRGEDIGGVRSPPPARLHRDGGRGEPGLASPLPGTAGWRVGEGLEEEEEEEWGGQSKGPSAPNPTLHMLRDLALGSLHARSGAQGVFLPKREAGGGLDFGGRRGLPPPPFKQLESGDPAWKVFSIGIYQGFPFIPPRP